MELLVKSVKAVIPIERNQLKTKSIVFEILI